MISPYSSVMSLMVMPAEACSNLQEMEKLGFCGRIWILRSSRLYKFAPAQGTTTCDHSFLYGAPPGNGISFFFLSHLLLNQPLQKRFISDVQFQSTLLFTTGKDPRVSVLDSPGAHISDTGLTGEETDTPIRVIATPHTPVPEVQLLSNGRYHVMITNAGGGYSRWKDIAVTRWREPAPATTGATCYIRDLESGEYWSSGFSPL